MFSKFKNGLFTWLVSRPAKVFAGLFVFYCLFGYFAVNPIAKKMVPWLAEKKLASAARVGQVSFDPLRLKATIDNFKLTQKNGEPLAGFSHLVVDLEASGFFKRAWTFKEISIVDPQASIAISAQGKLNWADLIAKLDEDKTPPDGTIPRLIIDHVSVKKGNIEYLDANRQTPLKAILEPLDLELGRFSTLPQDRGDYLIAASFPEQGGTLKWKGSVGVNPVTSNGAIAIDGLKLAKLMQVVKGVNLPMVASQGDVQTSFSYIFSLPNDKPKLTLNKLALNLRNVAGDGTAGKLALNHADLSLSRLDFSMQKQPELHLHDIGFALTGLILSQGKDTEISLKSSDAKLPQLDFVMHETPQLQFQDLNVKLADLNIRKGQTSLLALPHLDVNKVSLDLAARQAQVGQVLAAQGAVSALLDKFGNVNWQQAFASEKDSSSTDKPDEATRANPFSLDIADVQLQHWKLAFEDQAFLNPLQVNATDFNLGLSLAMPKGDLVISQVQSEINGISAKSVGNKSVPNSQVASLDKIKLVDGEVNLAKQNVNLPSITISGLKTQLIKEANKPLNWQTILDSASNASNSTNNKGSEKSNWAVSLKKLALENANIHIEDRSMTSPVVMDVEKIKLEVLDSSLDLKRQLPVKASFQVKQGGQFSTQGKLTPSPFTANLDLKLNSLVLKPFAPYINQFALLELNQGAADLTGKLQVKQGKELALNFAGGFAVNSLNIVEQDNHAPFLSWERLSSHSLQVSLAPNQVQMAELQISKPAGKFIINPDKTMNVTRILRNQAAVAPLEAPTAIAKPAEHPAIPANTGILDAAKASFVGDSTAPKEKPIAPPPSEAVAEDSFPMSIETVRIENAAVEFADLSLTPQFGADIHSLSGVINGVSTNPSATAQVELDGRVNEYGSAKVRGSLQPFKATNFTDIKLSFTNLDMNRLTPYSGKFAGRRIDSGKLSADLEYKIKQRQLAGENKFIINKLKLGEKVDSSDAANLPLDLAIAILEDSDGVIDLDLPISGSLDDPKFSYGSIVWKAIKNVLGKIVTSPFRALGKLFGGGGEKLEAITFDAGLSKLNPPEFEKLKMVSDALAKRQGLALGVVPGFDEALDTAAVQEFTLRRRVAEEMGLELAEGQIAGPIDLTNPKVQKAVDSLYDTLTKKSLIKKMAAKLEKPKEGHFEEAVSKLTASIKVTDADLQALAKSRAKAIQDALIASGVAAERLHVDAPEKSKSDAKAKSVNTRLTLDVKANKAVLPADGAAQAKPAQ